MFGLTIILGTIKSSKFVMMQFLRLSKSMNQNSYKQLINQISEQTNDWCSCKTFIRSKTPRGHSLNEKRVNVPRLSC